MMIMDRESLMAKVTPRFTRSETRSTEDMKIRCSSGWDDIIHRAIDRLGEIDPDFQIDCIKEKF